MAAIAKKRDVEHRRRNHWLRMIEDYIKQNAKPNIIKSAFENEGMRNPIGFNFRTKKLGCQVATKQKSRCPIWEDLHRIERCVKYDAMCNLRSMQECETTQSAFQILMQNHKGDDSYK
ncbi:hypothetical protein T06_4254 [Trichinella sp. T6]|nr:hypothetical protein T06_4254 [Trichinella sp. T6]